MKAKHLLWKIFWGLGFVLAAAFLIIDALGFIAPLESFMGEVSIWAILLGLLMVAFIISDLIKRKFAWIFIPLSIIFMLFEKNIAIVANLEDTNIINNWIVLASAILLTIGVAILLPSRKKKKIKAKKQAKLEFSANGAENSFGSSSIYVDCTDFTPSHIENNLGACTVQFQNVENYAGGKTLYIENNLGAIDIRVPSAWIVRSLIDSSLGGVDLPNEDDKVGPIVYIKGENNLGSVSVTYI